MGLGHNLECLDQPGEGVGRQSMSVCTAYHSSSMAHASVTCSHGSSSSSSSRQHLLGMTRRHLVSQSTKMLVCEAFGVSPGLLTCMCDVHAMCTYVHSWSKHQALS